jgi:hypothetical protein
MPPTFVVIGIEAVGPIATAADLAAANAKNELWN